MVKEEDGSNKAVDMGDGDETTEVDKAVVSGVIR